ncbi:protease inhibitor I42 family protein [Nocardia flavorosea]|uniref:ImmA/IrrE family metallo-endopeptidase n=1 Tax=Nocardia flavorosea TaxID=53429 RepID=A0A846YJU9_9NOCA|nr:protease inhibitor I42 family protein [Nocardia flavorosea]NKY59397.1 ImmA/IrrE family metallo-endopeptidase [Nocardia flavorosea]
MRTPMDRPVDVFALTQHLGVWLATQPLDNTYGFYLNDNDAAGIVLNSRHPEVLQRYTCAHELGHHLLGHGSHTDDKVTVEASADVALREQQAQAFAAALLMPGPLVNHTLRRLHTSAEPAAGDIYLASRDLAVSYSAMVWGLAELNRLDRRRADALSEAGVRPVKDALRGGPPIADARADLWTLEIPVQIGTEAIQALTCRVGDEIHIRLPEDLGTGYTWSLADPHRRPALDVVGTAPRFLWDGASHLTLGPTAIAPVEPEALPTDSAVLAEFHTHPDNRLDATATEDHDTLFDLVGTRSGHERVLPGLGMKVFVVSPGAAGQHTFQFRLIREWESTRSPAAHCRVTVTATPRRTLPRQGFAPRQNERRVHELAAA